MKMSGLRTAVFIWLSALVFMFVPLACKVSKKAEPDTSHGSATFQSTDMNAPPEQQAALIAELKQSAELFLVVNFSGCRVEFVSNTPLQLEVSMGVKHLGTRLVYRVIDKATGKQKEELTLAAYGTITRQNSQWICEANEVNIIGKK